MYDDLSSLAAKLKMTGVSFQEIQEEDAEQTQVATTSELTSETPDAEDNVSASLVNNAVSENVNVVETAPISAPVNNLNKVKPKTTQLHSVNSLASAGIMESVAAMTQPSEKNARERNPVRLDVLFAVIGQ